MTVIKEKINLNDTLCNCIVTELKSNQQSHYLQHYCYDSASPYTALLLNNDMLAG